MSFLHDQARVIFERIRDIPYRLPEFSGDEAPQCAYKSYRLKQELENLGYEVTVCVAEMDWSKTLFPKPVIDLYPVHIVPTHMYLNILEDGVWRPLDASWDKNLGHAGFPIAEFDGCNSPGLPLVKIYNSQEQETCLKYWSEPDHIKAYFLAAGLFLEAANKWLASIRSS